MIQGNPTIEAEDLESGKKTIYFASGATGRRLELRRMMNNGRGVQQAIDFACEEIKSSNAEDGPARNRYG